MTTTNQRAQVREFMVAFGQETPSTPTIPSIEIRRLRAKLILEEALETIEAMGLLTSFTVKNIDVIIRSNAINDGLVYFNQYKEPNLTMIADGLADLHYVGYLGTSIACGISNMDEIFNIVHQDNIDKFWTSQEVSEAYKQCKTQKGMQKTGDIYYWDNFKASKTGDRYLVIDKSGKVIKSPHNKPPNIIVK